MGYYSAKTISMRIPPNLKYFVFFILIMGVITVATLYLPRYIPNIGQILTVALTTGVILITLFTFVKPLFTFLYARAEGILEVYTDKGNDGFHVFAYHLNSGGDPPGPSTRDILHYYVTLQTGKLYYKKVFSHDMEPVSGRSGWSGYSSFEESVLGSAAFKKSMAKLSGKSGTLLQLGNPLQSSGDDHYSFTMNDKKIELKKFDGALDEGVRIICTDAISGEQLWKKKI